jgi:predicted amidohydrolase
MEQRSFIILLQLLQDYLNLMEAGTTGTCCSQWIFYGMYQRVGTEKPWNLGKFYGSSYFVDPRGQIFAQASEDKDELL